MRKRVARSLWILLVASIIWIGAIGLAVLSLARSLKGDPISLSFNADVVRCLPGAKRAALPVLLNALENTDSHVRWNAGSALGFLRFRASEVIPKLIGLLGHENPGVRWNACFLLGNLGHEAEPAIPSLIAVVQDERAGEILHEGGAGSGKRFYEVFKDHSVRSAAAEALGKIGPIARSAVPSLIQALKDLNPFVRLDAAVAMWRIEGNGAHAVPVLIDLLTERSETQRQELLWSEAANALGEIGPDAKQAVPALIRVLSRGSGEAREQAASALGKIGSLAKAAEPELLKALNDEAPFLRIQVAEALARIGSQSEAPVWALVDVLKDASHPPFARQPAMRALSLFGSNAQLTIVALIEATSDTDPLVSDLAGEILNSLAPEPKRDAVATLNEALASKDPHVRVVAVEALWHSTGRTDKTIPILLGVLTAKELLARRWAARALGDAKPEHGPAVLPALLDKLKDQDLQVRVFAAEAIWNIEGKSSIALATLVEVLKDNNNPGRARTRAAYALGRIGSAAKEAVPTLRQASADETCWDVHVAATRALDQIMPAPVDATTTAKTGAVPRVIHTYPRR